MLVDELSNSSAQRAPPADGGVVETTHHYVGSQPLLDYLPRKGRKQGQEGCGRVKPEA